MGASSLSAWAAALLATFAVSGVPSAPGEDKIDVFCGGDVDVCKLSSQLLDIRRDVLDGASFESAARTHAAWAWQDGTLVCEVGATAITDDLLGAVGGAGLALLDAFEGFGLHVLTVAARDVASLEALAHRPDVRGITARTPGATHPLPPVDPARAQRLSVRASPRGALKYRASAEWLGEEAVTRLAVSIRIGGEAAVEGDLAPGGAPGTWVLRGGARGRGVVVTLDVRTGDLRLRARGTDTSAFGPSVASVPVIVRLGSVVSVDELTPRRRSGRRSTWASDR